MTAPPAAPVIASSPAPSSVPLDVAALRTRFPILDERVHDRPLVYLDNAATTQKPLTVIETLDHYYRHDNANVHRGLHALSERATDAYEAARRKVAEHINAHSERECVFVRGATEAINLVAGCYARGHLGAGDGVLITGMEHHSNIVPWQLACEASGAVLEVVDVTPEGELDWESFERLIEKGPRVVSVVWTSNALGTINPVRRIVARAHEVGAVVLLDACQTAAHGPIDVREVECDFLALSGHKMFGPTGIGVLWGREELLAGMPPYQGGGEMIERVTFEHTTFAAPPARFEAGTPHIAGAIGLGAAVDFLESLDWPAVAAHEADLLAYGTARLGEIHGLRLIGTAQHKASILAFVIDGVHPYDVGPVLDRYGIAVRTGHHCAQPLMDRFGVPATLRASLAMYNTRDEIDALVQGLHKAMRFFR